ncbi:MAPEG family protein [Sphingomonas sp. So64.6b]|uniref:MAPEG family protein n=1 Tax=Sphingomonas sp. So64.6b TaxID=2997354 RepID=UPI001603D991|nr:MAPEG family protein [Sphingomonas sp. So64.6b]QNA84080.1 MAPEG family protein [Sphingomonas sp. So64.6b]
MTDHSPILAPIVVLIAWSLIMWLWMYVRRIPAMAKAGIDTKKLVGGNGSDLRARIPAKDQWPADNYNHLMEQPTLFYAIALVLALTGTGGGVNLSIAWAYVGLRIVHSLIQVTVNRVMVRFAIFALSTLCLMALTLHAAMAVFH